MEILIDLCQRDILSQNKWSRAGFKPGNKAFIYLFEYFDDVK